MGIRPEANVAMFVATENNDFAAHEIGYDGDDGEQNGDGHKQPDVHGHVVHVTNFFRRHCWNPKINGSVQSATTTMELKRIIRITYSSTITT